MDKFYRDDDINVYTSADELKRIHAPFQKHNKIHTVACEMKDLWYNKSLFWFLLNDPLINVELHGWTHENLMNMDLYNVMGMMKTSRDYWHENAARMLSCNVFNLPDIKKITTFFPPWNQVTPNIEEACRKLKLRLSYKDSDCHWMFHYWATTPKEVEEHIR